MRLLNVNSLEFAEFRDDKRPKYVIASHRWVEGCEVTLRDICDGRNIDKSGYTKLIGFAKYVEEYVPGVEWLWMDTCCIDKTNAAELSRSLNLMFDWYSNAELCIAYLMDVQEVEDRSAFAQSEWFRRGWTLQELLASRLLVFVTARWQVIGNKGASTYVDYGCGPGLEKDIAAITRIPERVLRIHAASDTLSVEEKLKWMEGRTTTEPEDLSYALYGIFGVTPGANYGEGREGARQRLLAAIHFRDNVALQHAERFQKIAEWLSPPDPWTNHQSARQLHEPRSGSWLLQSDVYQDWKKNSSSTRHLWMHGKSGCGKTVLCSTAVEDVKAHCKDQPDVGYAVFYFSFSDERKQRLPDLLCSLVVQLGWKGPALSMLQQAFDKPNRSALGVQELENALLTCLEAYRNVLLLLDALDEIPEDSDVRQSVFECLIRVSQKAHNVKVFATSHELPDIRISAERLGALSLPIATHSVDEDIRQYIATQLIHDSRLLLLDQKTRVLIEQSISQKADGMFRWAYCQLQEVKRLKAIKPKYVKELLNNLPATLDATYERMICRIEDMFRKEALTLLQWLAYAQSPPTLGELAEATIIDLTAAGSVDVDERGTIEGTLQILAGLVLLQDPAGTHRGDDALAKVDYVSDNIRDENLDRGQKGVDAFPILPHARHLVNKDTKVRLAHFSVKEYLESTRILGSKACEFHLKSAVGHRLLAQSCLTYLLHYSRSGEKSSTTQDLDKFPLLRYAARCWPSHSILQQAQDVTRETSLLTCKDAMPNWLLVFQPDKPWSNAFEPLEEIGSGLYYASFTGLGIVVRNLLEKGADVNAQGGRFGNALQAASSRGYAQIVRLLLEKGADVNAQGGTFGYALHAASFEGYTQVVRLLLEKGADVNAQGGLFDYALQIGCFVGHAEIVRLLLKKGAEVNAQGGHFGYALQAASFVGHVEIVLLLLKKGAEVNAKGGHFGYALQAASFAGHAEVVRLLLEKGAEVNAKGGHFGNALQAAESERHTQVVQLLRRASRLMHKEGTTATHSRHHL